MCFLQLFYIYLLDCCWSQLWNLIVNVDVDIDSHCANFGSSKQYQPLMNTQTNEQKMTNI